MDSPKIFCNGIVTLIPKLTNSNENVPGRAYDTTELDWGYDNSEGEEWK